ncbi:hypothetical protein T01_8745 [Trichinella spiralis]|uniref:Uncharacterized protein n=1 Tax=Trichinella spiralis TaxID=6334 RepID=A0A0V1B8Z8_TRISP|nr:hypothetical protein T01_8745 [Trichinella spiralis]
MRRAVRRPVDKAYISVQEDANEVIGLEKFSDMLHMPEQYAKLWKLIHTSCAIQLNFLSEPLHKAIGESSLNMKTDSTPFMHPGERSKKERQKTAEQDLKDERKTQRLLHNTGITAFKSKINNIVTKIVVDTGAALALVRMDQTGEAFEGDGAIFIAGARVWLLCQRSKRKLSKKLSRPEHVSFELVQRIFKLGKDAKTDSSEGIHRKTGEVREHSSTSERREYRIEEPYNPRPLQKARQLDYCMIEELLQKPLLRKTATECAAYAALALRTYRGAVEEDALAETSPGMSNMACINSTGSTGLSNNGNCVYNGTTPWSKNSRSGGPYRRHERNLKQVSNREGELEFFCEDGDIEGIW